MYAHTAIPTNAEPDLPEPRRDGIYIRSCILHTHKETHIHFPSETSCVLQHQPTKSRIQYYETGCVIRIHLHAFEMIKTPIMNSPPPGPWGFSEIQQHSHPVVKFEKLEERKILDFAAVGFYFLKVWLSQAQFSDMKTQQGWKICVIKYK